MRILFGESELRCKCGEWLEFKKPNLDIQSKDQLNLIIKDKRYSGGVCSRLYCKKCNKEYKLSSPSILWEIKE